MAHPPQSHDVFNELQGIIASEGRNLRRHNIAYGLLHMVLLPQSSLSRIRAGRRDGESFSVAGLFLKNAKFSGFLSHFCERGALSLRLSLSVPWHTSRLAAVEH